MSAFFRYVIYMFTKKKKAFPKGTFIPMPLRILATIQLCIAFSIICWNASQPFMGDLFTYKSKALLYEYVMNEDNQAYFEKLPTHERLAIEQDYQTLQKQSSVRFTEKLKRSIRTVRDLSAWTLAWLLLSILVSLFLLLRIEGAMQAAWLLPILAGCYLFDNQINGQLPTLSAEERLFPSEQYLVAHYSKEPLSSRISEQQNQLKSIWKRYLIEEWTDHGTIEQGEFAFTIARIKALNVHTLPSSFPKRPLTILVLFFLWNLAFAGFMVIQTSQSRQKYVRQ